MLVAGVDVGAATAKTAIVKDGVMISYDCIPTGDYVDKAARDVTLSALSKAGYTMKDLDTVCSTGYGRRAVYFSERAISEIICHAKGVNNQYPEVRTIIDIGGQDSKAISVMENGMVADFVMNDKCAAGTGRFLEVMAEVLKLTIDEMGPEALKSKNPSIINSTCTIFAESEMVSLRAEKTPREDMVAGLHRAVARRVAIMGRTIGYNERVAFTGGVAKNPGIVYWLGQIIGTDILVPEQPQIMGALGAALLADSNLGTTDITKDSEYAIQEDVNASGEC